jgi:TolB-like protein/DNA-binding winged helix-turn-helix (wHTH) protein/Tfp pilus assembly protein PilF
MPRHLRFGSYRLDTVSRELHGADDAPVPLTGKAFDTLLCLVERHERIVGKDELIAAVWPGRVVEENNLTQAISALRRALGADAGVIVTVPGRGYRFAGELVPPDAPGDAPEAEADTATPAAASAVGVAPSAAAPAAAVPPARRAYRVPTRAIAWTAVALAAIATAGLAWRLRAPSPAPAAIAATLATAASPQGAASAPTLAVLPFRSLSPGARDSLLELGLAETLIARTSSATRLRVRSLASSQRFAGAGQDPQVAGRQLGADYVVEGTTQRSGDRVRVNARLIAVDDGSTVWSGTFDESIARVFTLQDGMAASVASALALRWRAPAAGNVRSPCDGADAIAYRDYLVGRYQLDRPSAARLREALAAFRRAIDRDPTCARAYAGMATAYRALVMTADEDPRELFPLSKAAVARALAIDPNLAEAHAQLGFNRFWYDWDWAGSEAAFRRAIALNPNLAEAHLSYAHLLSNLRRPAEAAVQAREAVALDPLSPLVLTLASSFVGEGGDRAMGQRLNDKALELDPEFFTALFIRAGRRAAAKDYSGAIADLERARVSCGDCTQVLAVLGSIYVRAGQRDRAEQVLRGMEARARERYVPATSLATVRNALGDSEGALDLLERAYAERDVRLSFLAVDNRWRNLRALPRFQALARRMGLPMPPLG